MGTRANLLIASFVLWAVPALAVLGTPDNSTFTEGTTPFLGPTGGEFNDSPAAVSSGKAGVCRLTPQRALHVNLRDQTGTPIAVGALPTIVQQAGNVTASGTTVTTSLTPTAGNTFVVLCGDSIGTNTLLVTDNNANTYTVAKTQQGSGTSSTVAFAVNVNAGATTFTCTAGATATIAITAYEVSGLLTQVASQPDGTDGNNAATTNSATLSAAIAPVGVNDLIFSSVFVKVVTASCLVGSGWAIDTQQTASASTLCPLHRPLATGSIAAGSTIATFNVANYAQATAAFRPVPLGMPQTIKVMQGTGPFTIAPNAWSVALVNSGGGVISTPYPVTLGTALPTGSATIGKVDVLGNAGAAMDAAGQNAASPANSLLTGCQFNTSPTTIASGNMSPAQCTAAGNHKTDLTTIAGTAPSTAGKVDVKAADGDLFCRQATAANLNMTAAQGAAGATAWPVTQSPTTAATNALTATSKSAVTTSVNVKASAGNVYGLSVLSGATSGCWLELINSATAGTLGTAVIVNIALPNAGVVNITPGVFALSNFSSGIAVGVASAIGGASACATSSGITVFYN